MLEMGRPTVGVTRGIICPIILFRDEKSAILLKFLPRDRIFSPSLRFVTFPFYETLSFICRYGWIRTDGFRHTLNDKLLGNIKGTIGLF